jgi:hypothetical protein
MNLNEEEIAYLEEAINQMVGIFHALFILTN